MRSTVLKLTFIASSEILRYFITITHLVLFCSFNNQMNNDIKLTSQECKTLSPANQTVNKTSCKMSSLNSDQEWFKH